MVFLTNVALSYNVYIMIKHVLHWQYDSFIELCEIACSLTIVSSNNSNGTINQYYKEQSTRARTEDNWGCGIARCSDRRSVQDNTSQYKGDRLLSQGAAITRADHRGSLTSDSPIKGSPGLPLDCTVHCIVTLQNWPDRDLLYIWNITFNYRHTEILFLSKVLYLFL